jgi:hypothetical protein
MFWLGGLVGLLVGICAGVGIMCVVSIHRVNEMGDVLDRCRRELSCYAFQSGTAMAACYEAAKCLKDQGWWSG